MKILEKSRIGIVKTVESYSLRQKFVDGSRGVKVRCFKYFYLVGGDEVNRWRRCLSLGLA